MGTSGPDSLRRIEAARSGDQRAADELLVDLLPELRAYVRLRCGAAVRAQESCSDLVQSVCREVLGNLEGAERKNEAVFKAWLFRVAEHRIIDKVRYMQRDKRDVRREQRAEAEGVPIDVQKSYASFLSPSRQLASKEQLERIEGAFDKIPERYRDIILMARIAGLSYEELGERFECTAHSARTLLSRAVARLAAALGPDFETG